MSGTVFGLDDERVRAAVAGVRRRDTAPRATLDDGRGAGRAADGVVSPDGREAARVPRREPERSEIAECFARAAWSCIAEPGDSEAGALVAALGASRALSAVIDRWPAERAGRGPAGWQRGLERWSPRLDSNAVLRALTTAAGLRIQLLLPSDGSWPEGLADLGDHAPMALWCRGEPAALAAPTSGAGSGIAVVGARAATGYGEHVASESAAGLAERGFPIVSGAAYGIDGAAHRAALAAHGSTVAFLAGGVDRLYPSGHTRLLHRIADTGAVVSEVPCGTAPTRWRFLQRNRLIAAMSSVVVVVEAGLRSGSLNTAGHAAALGRAVGAVPGPVTSPSSAGCHRLLRDYGAVCVSNAEQIAELTGWSGRPDSSGAGDGPPGSAGGARGGVGVRPSAEETRLIDALSARRPRSVDELARRSGLSRREVEGGLGLLSASGRATEGSGGWVLRASRAADSRVGADARPSGTRS